MYFLRFFLTVPTNPMIIGVITTLFNSHNCWSCHANISIPSTCLSFLQHSLFLARHTQNMIHCHLHYFSSIVCFLSILYVIVALKHKIPKGHFRYCLRAYIRFRFSSVKSILVVKYPIDTKYNFQSVKIKMCDSQCRQLHKFSYFTIIIKK